MGDRLADVAYYLACLITLVGTAVKALSDRGRRSDPALRYVYACGLCMGLGLVLTPPATFAAASGLGFWPVKVADAFTTSPAVAGVRGRVRDELNRVPG